MKKLTALFLTLLLLFSLSAPALAAQEKIVPTSQALTVDGAAQKCEIYNIGGSNYFKLRDIAYLLNGTGSQFEVGWDGATKTVTVTTGKPYTSNGTELVMRTLTDDQLAAAGKSPQTILINGQPDSSLDAYLIGGNNFFKLRALGEALGFKVDYDTPSRTMIVESSGPSADRKALNAEQIYARCIPAVFLIDVYDDYGDWIGSGSGFFIDNKGTAVTNHHVLYGASSAKATLSDSTGRETDTLDVLGVYAWSDQNEEDWAVIKVDVTGNPYLRIGEKSTAVGGATVYALGSPLGLTASISNGIISNPARSLDGQIYIQTNAAIDHGSSGGALVNAYGEVIGITCGGFNGQNLNIAIPISAIEGAAHGDLTPIDETYVIASGYIYPETYYVSLAPGETFTDVITAIRENTDERLHVSSYVDDPSIVSLSWGDWPYESTTLDLYLTAGSTLGRTTVTIYLETAESETFLDYCTITVEVVGGYVEPELDYLELGVDGSASIRVAANTYDGRGYKVRVDDYNEDIVEFAWGDWDGVLIPLNVHALACGETYVSLYLIDSASGDVLAENGFYLSVYGGTLEISEYEIMLAPGESRTVTITGAALDPNVKTVITADEWSSDVIDWQRGTLGSGTVSLKITALAEGNDCVLVTLLDEEGQELNYAFIDVYVSMDGQ